MTPQLANRLVLGYVLVSFASLFLIIPLAGLLGAVKGALLAIQGLPFEDLAIEVKAWAGAVTGELFPLALALAIGAFAYWLYTNYVRKYAHEIGWKNAPVTEVIKVAFVLLLFKIGFGYFSTGLFPRSYHEHIGLLKGLTASTAWGWVALFLFVVLLAPLVEEWLFRGLMLRSYALRRGTHFALYAQALIFGLIHGKPMLILNALFIGWILGRVVLAGTSLKTAFWAHAAFNATSFIVIMLLSTNPAAPVPKSPTTNVLFGLAIMLLVILVAARHWRPVHQPPVERGPVTSGSLWAVLAYSLIALLAFQNSLS